MPLYTLISSFIKTADETFNEAIHSLCLLEDFDFEKWHLMYADRGTCCPWITDGMNQKTFFFIHKRWLKFNIALNCHSISLPVAANEIFLSVSLLPKPDEFHCWEDCSLIHISFTHSDSRRSRTSKKMEIWGKMEAVAHILHVLFKAESYLWPFMQKVNNKLELICNKVKINLLLY